MRRDGRTKAEERWYKIHSLGGSHEKKMEVNQGYTFIGDVVITSPNNVHHPFEPARVE